MKKWIVWAVFTLALARGKAVTWHMATPYPDRQFHTQNIKKFIEDVETATDGKVKIVLHSGGALYKAPEIFRAVRSDQIALGELLISSLGNDDPLFKLDTLPFLATDYAAAEKLWRVSSSAVAEKLAEKGVVLLYTVPWPGQNFYTNAPVETIEDFQGKKIRAYNAQTAAIAAQLGAVPTTIEVSDIAQAFTTSQIDAMITSSSTGVTSQAWDFVKYFTSVNAWYPKNMVFLNKRQWRRLDEDSREKILAAARTAQARGFTMSVEDNQANLKTLANHGMTIAEPSPQIKRALDEIGEKMAAQWGEEAGPEGRKILSAFRKE